MGRGTQTSKASRSVFWETQVPNGLIWSLFTGFAVFLVKPLAQHRLHSWKCDVTQNKFVILRFLLKPPSAIPALLSYCCFSIVGFFFYKQHIY